MISDEIYSELTFEGEHVSIASLPGMKERTIFLHGFSKAFAMTGWRIGYACGPAALIEAMMKVHQYSMMCASIISQEAAIEALERGEDSDEAHARAIPPPPRLHRAPFQRDRPHLPSAARVVLRLSRRSRRPGSATRISRLGLLQAEKVAVVPGTAFGANGARLRARLLCHQLRAARSRPAPASSASFVEARAGLKAISAKL